MSRFLSELDCRGLDDGRWELLSSLVYDSDVADQVIAVPSGFITDFASVPRVPVIYTLFGDRAHREAVIHDFLYQTHLTTKSVADRVFKEAMEVRGKSAFVRWGMYLGVVLGGKSSYDSGPSRYMVLNDQKQEESK